MLTNLPIDPDLVTGIDVGGTKVHLLDSHSHSVRHSATPDYTDLYHLLDDYFEETGARPSKMAIAIAGPRDDVTGAVKMSNSLWPTFNPNDAAKRYPGTIFETFNDMNATAAGVASANSDSFKLLKGGQSSEKGNKAVVAISTGFGVGIAAYNRTTAGYTLLDSEVGHSGFQPYSEIQNDFLKYLLSRYTDPSWELALSGKHGIDNWLDFLHDKIHAPKLGGALERAAQTGRPRGAVLLEFATEGLGEDKEAAHKILDYMACLTASALSNVALSYKSTGGIYLTGSVALALAEYWAEETDFLKSFMRKGTADHAPWLESFLTNVPIYLVTDPHIAVKGALALAEL